jgi:hypothetical protein
VVYLLAAAALVLSAQPRGGKGKGKEKDKEATSVKSSRTATVIELFTSEGCSSCPPADELLLKMAGNFIVLGEHVDYWDGDGWKDRYSSPLFSARQQDYGREMRTGNVFTPQVVINGREAALASDSGAVSRAITEASYGSGMRTEIELEITEEGTLKLKVGKLPEGGHKSDVLLAIVEKSLQTEVQAGENAGRTLRHVPVVHSMTRMAELDPAKPGEWGAEARLNLREEWKRENVQVVVLVQDQQNLRMTGAASIAVGPEKPKNREKEVSKR